MKTKITGMFTNTIERFLSNTPSVKLERKIDGIQTVVNRNKLIAYTDGNIDEVIASVKCQKVKYKIHY